MDIPDFLYVAPLGYVGEPRSYIKKGRILLANLGGERSKPGKASSTGFG